jgi:hypothetical protein
MRLSDHLIWARWISTRAIVVARLMLTSRLVTETVIRRLAPLQGQGFVSDGVSVWLVEGPS